MHPPPRLPRLAHVGAGRFSRSAHGPALQRLAAASPPRLTLDGIADADATRPARAREFCRTFGYRAAYDDVQEMLERVRPDLLVCVADLRRHAAMVALLLPTRIPLLLEKPPGESAAEAAMLAELARTHHTRHYVAFNRRRVPAVASARRWLGRLGTPSTARAEMLRQHRTDASFALATGIHVVDTLRYLLGEMTHMDATVVEAERGSRDYRAQVRFASGCHASLGLSMDAPLTRETYAFDCADATRVEVTVGPPYSAPGVWAGLRVWRGGRVCHEEPAPDDPLIATGILGEYRAFLDAIDADRQPDCSLDDAWRSMVAAEALARGHQGDIAIG